MCKTHISKKTCTKCLAPYLRVEEAVKQEDEKPLKIKEQNNVTRLTCFIRKRLKREELTCNELNTAKIYKNASECVLTARTPKIQEMPRMGRSTATALAVSLQANREIRMIVTIAVDKIKTT